jgi:hypothetical protein
VEGGGGVRVAAKVSDVVLCGCACCMGSVDEGVNAYGWGMGSDGFEGSDRRVGVGVMGIRDWRARATKRQRTTYGIQLLTISPTCEHVKDSSIRRGPSSGSQHGDLV